MPSWAGSNEPFVSTFPAESSSITVVGGTRPRSPRSVGGITGPGPRETTVGVASSVVVRFEKALDSGGQPGVQPGRNSCTRPLTVTDMPAVTVGGEPVNTNTPSDVAASPSGCGSWNQKPLVATAVTTPGTCETRLPA
jgi:hypothetical protein